MRIKTRWHLEGETTGKRPKSSVISTVSEKKKNKKKKVEYIYNIIGSIMAINLSLHYIS